MIGRKSNLKNFIVALKAKKDSVTVRVQADKNGGICDIILPKTLTQPIKPLKPTKKSMKAYKEAMYAYRSYMKDLNAVRSQILSIFRGRPLSSETTRIHLSNVLYEIMN